MENLNYIKRIILAVFVFISPVFFLTTTSEFYQTNKFYLLALFTIALMVINAIEIVIRKRADLRGNRLDAGLGLFVLALVLSVVFASTNRVQALLSMNLGLIPVFFAFVFYLFVSRSDDNTKALIDHALFYSSAIVSVLAVFFFFQPFASVDLPLSLQFLRQPFFTPMGTPNDLAVFIAFATVYRAIKKKFTTVDIILLALNISALGVTLFYLFKTTPSALSPFRISWYAAIEVLKTPLTALFGVGLDNFSIVFTRVKDVLYNQSPLWQVSGFSVSRSLALHVLTEAGLLGFASLVFVFFASIKEAAKDENKLTRFVAGLWALLVLVFPVSFYTLFLFFLGLALMTKGRARHEKETEEAFPIYISAVFLILAAVAASGYLLSRAYLAEYYFKRSLNGLVSNNAKEVYDNMRESRIQNPYNERVVLNFSQTNLIIANNVSQKKDLTEQDRQTIARAIQAAISEGKELIKLNPNKAQYWENLANIYRTMIPLAESADAWTISAYQRAVILDPQNPSYRLALGSVYYLLQRYDQAISFFEQAVALKPDWANGYYNLAWTYYQNKNFDKATLAMQNVVSLTNQTKNPQDYKKATEDLDQFKKQLPLEEENSATPSGQLNLPQPEPTIEPKLELPKEASPEAN